MSALQELLLALLGDVPVVTLSGESVLGADAPGPVTVGIRVTSGGIVERLIQGVWAQVDAATDWIIPNGDASGDYEVRLTVDSGTSPTSGTVGSWEALSSTRSWELTRQAVSGSGSTTGTYTIEIRQGTTVLASASYTLTATII